MTQMTPRERFRSALLFDYPDKVPLDPGSPRESTLAAWRRQGLSEAADWRTSLMRAVGIDDDALHVSSELDVDFRMVPPFAEKVLEHRDGHYVVQDWMGAITEISDEYDFTYIRSAKDFVTRKWHRFPVESRADWLEKIAWRYNASDPRRFPDDFAAQWEALRDRESVLGLSCNGPFWQLREWCGMEGLCLLMADQPEFVQEMIDVWSDFVSAMLARFLPHVELDYVQISEDMAYKQHSMISPAMTRRFLLPSWRRWVDVVKASGCPIASMDSDGYAAELLPLWIEAGFNCSIPTEVAAGNDIVAYRQQYGRRMAFLGGID
ncbi:MAG: hypothetical protein MUQ10_09435, partial [Anaerolineae bacterium]|nr:hypothetical protein [Anaerolineae bacterium]